MKKITLFTIAVVVVFGAILLFIGLDEKSQGLTDVDTSTGDISFVQEGYVSQAEGSSANGGLSLVYEKPGAPALSKKLSFDEDSKCVFKNQPTPCLALNATIKGSVGDQRVSVEGIENGQTVLVRTLTVVEKQNEQFVFIKEIKRNDQNVLITVDPVEFPYGNAAVKAAAEDTPCNESNVGDCIPSLYNNFYIRNVDSTTETYIVNTDTHIKTFVSPGAPDLHNISLETFLTEGQNPRSSYKSFPFKLSLDGALVTNIEEQYMP